MRIICFTPQKDNAISFYRTHGCLSEIHKIDKELQVEFPELFNIRTIKGAEVAYFMRPDTPEMLTVLMACKEIGMKIIVDYDDDLLNVPYHNKYHLIHLLNGVNYKQIITQCLQASDMVIVSTQQLKDEFSTHNKNIHVVRNAFDNYIYKTKTKRNVSNRILWRGSKFHQKDLQMFEREINQLIDENPDFDFMFMGDLYPRQFVKVDRKNVMFVKPVSVWEYQTKVNELNIALTIVPLKYTGTKTIKFNKAKSDIAKLELTAAGSLVIAPNWYEWNWCNDYAEGLYKDKQDFYNKTSLMIQAIRENDNNLDLMYKANLEYLKKYRLLSVVNKERANLIKSLYN